MKKLAWFLCLTTMLWVDQYGGTIWYEGVYIVPEPGPFIYGDTVMLPFRAVVEELFDGHVDWDHFSNKVTGSTSGQIATFHLNDKNLPVIVVQDRAFVPQKFIEQNFNTVF